MRLAWGHAGAAGTGAGEAHDAIVERMMETAVRHGTGAIAAEMEEAEESAADGLGGVAAAPDYE